MPTTSQCGNAFAMAMHLDGEVSSVPQVASVNPQRHSPHARTTANVDNGRSVSWSRFQDFMHGRLELIQRAEGYGQSVMLETETTVFLQVLGYGIQSTSSHDGAKLIRTAGNMYVYR